jgi:AcrR family transcriptional regulator
MSPRTRFQNLEPARRERILSAAALEFAERGYEAASVNRIIEEAGTSKGSLYYYFEDKEDLFATALEHASRRLLEEVGMPPLESLTADDYWDRFREVSRRSVPHLRRNEWYVRLARSFGRFRDEHGASAAVARIDDFARRSFRTLLQRGRELGVVLTDLPLDLLVEVSRALDEAGDRWMLDRWEGMSEEERERLAEARMDLLRDLLDAAHQGWDR